MTTAWSHLPNATHIDRITADLKTNSAIWTTAMNIMTSDMRHMGVSGGIRSAKDSTREVLYASNDNKSTLDAIRDAVWAVTRGPSAYIAAFNAIVALMAWPESADYLSLPRDQAHMMAMIGDQRAILILPAIIAFEKSEELL